MLVEDGYVKIGGTQLAEGMVGVTDGQKKEARQTEQESEEGNHTGYLGR
jgi:hypothetical protein